MHILAVIILHQHKFYVYKGKRKLKLLSTCENFVNIFLENVKKKVYSWEVLERVGRITANTFFFIFRKM